MESFLETFRNLDTSQKILYVFGGAAVTAVSLVAIRILTLKEEKRKDYPRDKVILHQIGRGPFAPSMTPFAVKLETYLRMARIPYQSQGASFNIFLWTIRRHNKKQTWNQGHGRHTEEEIVEMMNKDIQSLSDFVGRKRFLMGDEPSEADCSVFGMLSQTYWQFYGSGYENLIKDRYPNLASYCERMKDAFWPDWDQCITHGGTREATK
ncbi:failed axon connections homolog [Haliotis rufescens]|uniref:failed axon connections homolog n=1 Tax=Haliotis rufescens TaxID=6454 RepID=UPI001EB013A7|nr:failed axon connections homolog [Haliotis rufescens]